MKKDFFSEFMNDLKVELLDEFDRNFERKAFFDQKWEQTKIRNHRGTLMMRSGDLRRGLKASVQRNTIRFFNSKPYAAIHNYGGTITVTPRMKRFFWAMYYNRLKSRNNSGAAIWKSMALKKAGAKIKIPARPFIGHHPQVDRSVQNVFKDLARKMEPEIAKSLKKTR